MNNNRRKDNTTIAKILLPVTLLFIILFVILYLFNGSIWNWLVCLYDFLSDREQIKTWIDGFGKSAPIAFIFFQILQVIFAPVPGEATGFIGGYLFGAFKGFLFSSIGLTIGSWLNFFLGRFLGERYIRKLIPAKPLERFDRVLKRQGILVVLILFIFPGFPKDYLCLFLGLSNMPLRVFVVLATFGRMPGTLMLSLQGAYVYKKMYGMFALILVISALIALIAYLFRDRLYKWAEKSR